MSTRASANDYEPLNSCKYNRVQIGRITRLWKHWPRIDFRLAVMPLHGFAGLGLLGIKRRRIESFVPVDP